MKITVPIAASAGLLLVVLTLTGCTSGGLPGASGTPGSGSGAGGSGASTKSGGTAATTPTRAYSADNLVAILKSAQAARGLTGTIQDDAQLQAKVKAGTSTKSYTQQFAAEGGKFEPASCGNEMNQILKDSNEYGQGVNGIGAELYTGNDIIAVSSSTDPSKAAALSTSLAGILNTLATDCATLKIVVKPITVTMKITKLAATTTADQSYGFEEDATIPGAGIEKTATIEGVYGSLFIDDTALSKPDIATLEKNVDAVVAAAKE